MYGDFWNSKDYLLALICCQLISPFCFYVRESEMDYDSEHSSDFRWKTSTI